MKLIWMGLGGLLGTLARYGLSGLVDRRFGETFPTGTLVVNLVGCLLAGIVFQLLQERFLVDPVVRATVLIGFLGGFTTFSSFGLQTFTLLREGEMAMASLNMIASNLLGLFLVWAGYSLARIW